MDNLSEFFQDFIDEADQQLRRLNDGVLQLEQDPKNQDLINEVFRAAHTLKGGAATMGYRTLAELTHKLENVLDQARSGKKHLSGPIIDVLFESIDVLEQVLVMVKQTRTDNVEVSALVAKLINIDALSNTLGGPAADGSARPPLPASPAMPAVVLTDDEQIVVAQRAAAGMTAYRIEMMLDPETPMLAMNAFLVLNNLREKSDIIKSIPSETEMEGEISPAVVFVVAAAVTPAELEQCVNNVITPKSLFIHELAPGARAAVATAVAARAAGMPAAPTEPAPAKPQAASSSATLRVAGRRVDDTVNLVGELVINMARLQQIGNDLKNTYGYTELIQDYRENVLRVNRVLAELQEKSMSLRMVSISQVFDKFPRVCRDTAKTLGKNIELVIEGRDTELDKTVVDDLYEPLLHMVRNSMDHGIESPAARDAAAKPATGTVTLRAFHQGSNIVIEIEDDGAGLNIERIKNKARERGLVRDTDLNGLSDEDIIRFIFLPGFSTVEKVNDLSGRGVGMDVVRQSIEKLKGTVDIENHPGRGSKFVIRLPLTMAIISALLVRSGRECYAVPLSSIIELVRVNTDRIATIEGRQVIRVRDTVVPLLGLDTALHKTAAPSRATPADRKFVVIVSAATRVGAKRLVGITVDEFIGEQDVVIKMMDHEYSRSEVIAGATILGDGRVALILDVIKLINTVR